MGDIMVFLAPQFDSNGGDRVPFPVLQEACYLG